MGADVHVAGSTMRCKHGPDAHGWTIHQVSRVTLNSRRADPLSSRKRIVGTWSRNVQFPAIDTRYARKKAERALAAPRLSVR
jgi:hypothetical protein